MHFRSKHGPIPDAWLDNEVKMKANPDEGYSPEFVERQRKKLEELKAKFNIK